MIAIAIPRGKLAVTLQPALRVEGRRQLLVNQFKLHDGSVKTELSLRVTTTEVRRTTVMNQFTTQLKPMTSKVLKKKLRKSLPWNRCSTNSTSRALSTPSVLD